MDNTADEIFSYNGILTTLTHLNLHFGLLRLGDWDGRDGIILRHDVDLDVRAALDLAEIEAASGILGTYFFLTTSENYNILASSNQTLIRKIMSLGFEIGLHFDPALYPGENGEGLATQAKREAKIIEDVTHSPVVSVSLHNPSVMGEYPIFPGWKNAYDAEIFNKDIYLSDSRMNFTSRPVEFFARSPDKIRQLLLHPMNYSKSGAGYPAPFVRHLGRVASSLDEIFSVNSRYREKVPHGILAHPLTSRFFSGDGDVD